MGSPRYLNVVLTVIAVLMALELWTQWVGDGAGSTSTMTPMVHAAGIPNAGQQRQQIVDELRRLSQEVEAMHNLFRSGQARVKLETVPGNDH